MYSPVLGRFSSRDPLPRAGQPDILYSENWIVAKLAESPNQYCYILNNPVNLVDPSGLQAQLWADPEENDDVVVHRTISIVGIGERSDILEDSCVAVAKKKKYCRYDLVSAFQKYPDLPCRFSPHDVLEGLTIMCKGLCGGLTTKKCPEILTYREVDPNNVVLCEAKGKFLSCDECEEED